MDTDHPLVICHKPGKKNQNADALSQNPVTNDVTVNAVSVPEETETVNADEVLDMEVLHSQQQEDADLIPMLDYLKSGRSPIR